MAARQAELRGRSTLTDVLLTPRLVTRALLVLVGVVAAFSLWHLLSAEFLAYVAGLAGSFAMICASAVWSLRDKANEALSGEDAKPEKFGVYRDVARAIRRRMSMKAAYVVLCALFAISPAVSHQLAGAIWQWMVFASFVGTAEAAYSYVIAHAWEEELIDFRDGQILKAKNEARRLDLIGKLENARRAA